MIEKPAKDVTGFILYNPINKEYFFRVYDEHDKKKFTDYEIHAEDITVTIYDSVLSLYEREDGRNKLDWSSQYLAKDTITVYPKRNPSLEEIKAFIRAFPDGDWVTATRGVIESDDARVYLDYDDRYRDYFDKYLDEQQRAELTARLGFSPSLALHVQVSTAYQHSKELARTVCDALVRQWGGGWNDGRDTSTSKRD